MAVISSESENKKKKTDDDKLLEEALKRFKLCDEAEADIRTEALDDWEFSAGDQWPEKIKNERNLDGRPCLVINKTAQNINQITNDQRQNRPAIKVHAVDDLADVETAKIYQGLIRHIEYDSDAETAYDTAFDGAVRGGFGYWRVITQYVDSISFDQEIKIKRIRNPFSVFLDPYIQEADGSDANFGFIIEDLSKEEFLSQFPTSKLSSPTEWESIGNQMPIWFPQGGVRVAEYFYRENKEEEIVQLNTGEVLLKKDLPPELPEGVAIEKERKALIPKICWVKMSAAEILEKKEWPGKYIPIVPVYGAELDINGERILKGIVRDSKDPARQYNYFASAETEAVALAPRAPFIMAEGQDEGYKDMWAAANRRNFPALKYKPKSVDGTLLPPPQRQVFEPAVQAITQARMLAADDIKATTGIYDAALGNRSNETSGVAINSRKVQAQTSNFHFVDNLTRALKYTGRILIDLIPKIYDTPRAARIIGEDGEERVVRINQEFEDNGKPVNYQLDKGKYDITVDVGPSFASKRQEAAVSMQELARAWPQIMQVAGDLLVKNLDWPGAQELAERLKKTIPPELLDDMSKGGKDIPPHIQAQLQQSMMMIEQLTAQLNEAKAKEESDLISIESKERIEMAKLQTNATIELAKLESNEAVKLLSIEVAQLKDRLNMIGFDEPIPGTEESQQFSQEFSEPIDGGSPAFVEGEEQIPIGGVSPSTPMEGV